MTSNARAVFWLGQKLPDALVRVATRGHEGGGEAPAPPQLERLGGVQGRDGRAARAVVRGRRTTHALPPCGALQAASRGSDQSGAAVHLRTTHGQPDAPCCCPPSSPSRTAWVPPPDAHLDGSQPRWERRFPTALPPRLAGREPLVHCRPAAQRRAQAVQTDGVVLVVLPLDSRKRPAVGAPRARWLS